MPSAIEHKFETTVPPHFEVKRELVRDWASAVIEAVGGFDDVTNTRLDEIENERRDGFIPYTSGGFDAVGYGDAGLGLGSGSLPEAVRPYTDSAAKQHDEEWDQENPEHTTAWIFYRDIDDQLLLFNGVDPQRSAREEWEEEYYESYDAVFQEGWTYFYKVRALFHNGSSITKSESGEPEVLFCVGINTDFEYGRDNIPWLSVYGSNPNCTDWLWEKTVKVSDITNELVETMIEEASNALRRA